MKSIATILAVAALSWSAAAAEPAEAADDLKSSLLRFEAWTAKNTGVSVFAWKPLHGAVAQANLLPEGETSHAVSDTLQQCKDDSASLCRATFGQTLANDQQRFNAVQESMDCLHEHFERVSEPCVSAAHSAVDALGHEGLEVQQKVLARLADDTAQNMLSACSFDDVKQCAADDTPSEQHHKHGGRWRAMKASAGKPALGRDGHGQPRAHDGEHKPMLGRDGHGQPPARKASAGRLHPHGAPHHHRRGMRSMRRMRGEQAPHAPPGVSPEDAAQWFSAHSALTSKETAHLGSSIPAAAQCLAEQGHPDGPGSWTHGWRRRAARAPTTSPKCVKAAERWVQLANHGATVSEQSVQVQQKHTEQAPMPRDAWNMDVVLGNWGLEGVSAREHDGHPRWGGWEDDVDSPFHGWGDEEEFEARHRHHGGALGVLPILLLPILLCFGIRRCARNKRRRAAMAAADGATNVPPPPARFAQGPSPQQAAAAAASHAAAAPAVHYPFAASAPAPPAPQQVQANLYPDVDQSTWNVSSWFGGQPSAPGYAPVSVREA